MHSKSKRISARHVMIGATAALSVYGVYKLTQKYRVKNTLLLTCSYDNSVCGLPVPKVLTHPLGAPGVYFGTHLKNSAYQVSKPANVDGHVGVFGESSRGKTSGIVIPTMAYFPGPQFIIDTKGNLAQVWQQFHRNDGRKLKRFSPAERDKNPCWIDPFELLKYDPDNKCGHAWDLAEAILPTNRMDNSPVWKEAAQTILAGTLLYYFEEGWNFADALVQIASSKISELVQKIAASNHAEAAMFVKQLSDIDEKVLLNIGLDFRSLMQMVSVPAILNAFSPDSACEQLSLYDFAMGTENFDLIFEVPDAELQQLRPLVVLVLTQLMRYLARRPEQTRADAEVPPMLLLLDEFPRLGQMPSIIDGLNTLRSKKVTFLLCMQSIASLESLYGAADARVILENLSFKVILGATDTQSQMYFSRLIGDVLMEAENLSVGVPLNVSQSYHLERRPYIYPHAFQTLQDVIVVSPKGAFQVKKHRPWVSLPKFVKK